VCGGECGGVEGVGWKGNEQEDRIDRD